MAELLIPQRGGDTGTNAYDLTNNPYILFGVLGKAATHSETLKQKTQASLEVIIKNIQSEPYEPDIEICPICQSVEIQNRSFRPKNVKTVGYLNLSLLIRRKKCKKCGCTFSPTENLTLLKGRYDRAIVELGVLLYFGGCSYNYTQDVLYSTLGVAPYENAIRNWVLKLGLNAKRTNKSVLTRKTVKRFATDEQYFTLRIPGANETACATICIDLENNRIIDFKVTDDKQLNYLLAREALEPIDKNAELAVTDGAPAYNDAIKDALPNAYHQIDLIHRVKNKRKRKAVKKQFQNFKDGTENEERAKFEKLKADRTEEHKKKLNGSNNHHRKEDLPKVFSKESKENKKALRKN